MPPGDIDTLLISNIVCPWYISSYGTTHGTTVHEHIQQIASKVGFLIGLFLSWTRVQAHESWPGDPKLSNISWISLTEFCSHVPLWPLYSANYQTPMLTFFMHLPVPKYGGPGSILYMSWGWVISNEDILERPTLPGVSSSSTVRCTCCCGCQNGQLVITIDRHYWIKCCSDTELNEQAMLN